MLQMNIEDNSLSAIIGICFCLLIFFFATSQSFKIVSLGLLTLRSYYLRETKGGRQFLLGLKCIGYIEYALNTFETT